MSADVLHGNKVYSSVTLFELRVWNGGQRLRRVQPIQQLVLAIEQVLVLCTVLNTYDCVYTTSNLYDTVKLTVLVFNVVVVSISVLYSASWDIRFNCLEGLHKVHHSTLFYNVRTTITYAL